MFCLRCHFKKALGKADCFSNRNSGGIPVCLNSDAVFKLLQTASKISKNSNRNSDRNSVEKAAGFAY